MTARIFGKYFTAMLITFTVCTKSLKAQYSTNPKLLSEADGLSEWMEGNLDLSTKQLLTIKDLNVKYTMKFDSIRTSPADRFTKFQKVHRVMMERDIQFKSILTKEQFIAYQNAKAWKKNPFSLIESSISVSENEDINISN